MSPTSLRARPELLARAVHSRFTSRLHDERVAARLGLALGVLFTACAVTGAFSHLQQHPPGWLDLPPRPAGLYRVTQGVHVTAGFAAIPVLAAKLWTVAPKLVEWPPVRGAAHALERLLLLPLVGGGVFLLFSGVANVARWYPWTFFFPPAHLWAAWIAIGGLIVHVGATLPVTRRALSRRLDRIDRVNADADRVDRRRFLGGVAASASVLAVGILGGTVSWASPLSFLAQRRFGVGPQGIPVNKTAAEAKVAASALDPAYALQIVGAVRTPLSLTLADLAAMDQHEAELPIACVEGWSASAQWRGVRVRDLLALAGAAREAEVTVRSLEENDRYAQSELNHLQVADRDTLLATHVGGEPLHLDHGYPVRLIGPNRPGVSQTKWVGTLEVR